MPTDDVLSLIAEVRQLCDGMQDGPYEATGTDIHYEQGYVPACKDYMLVEEHEAAYFAALDPALVRALLDVVEAVKAMEDWNGGPGSSLWSRKAMDGMATLRTLAAERMTT
jgi:hypothetical protein